MEKVVEQPRNPRRHELLGILKNEPGFLSPEKYERLQAFIASKTYLRTPDAPGDPQPQYQRSPEEADSFLLSSFFEFVATVILEEAFGKNNVSRASPYEDHIGSNDRRVMGLRQRLRLHSGEENVSLLAQHFDIFVRLGGRYPNQGLAIDLTATFLDEHLDRKRSDVFIDAKNIRRKHFLQDSFLIRKLVFPIYRQLWIELSLALVEIVTEAKGEVHDIAGSLLKTILKINDKRILKAFAEDPVWDLYLNPDHVSDSTPITVMKRRSRSNKTLIEKTVEEPMRRINYDVRDAINKMRERFAILKSIK